MLGIPIDEVRPGVEYESRFVGGGKGEADGRPAAGSDDALLRVEMQAMRGDSQANTVLLESEAGVLAGATEVKVVAGGHRGGAKLLCLRNGPVRSPITGEMAHAAIAVEDLGGAGFTDDAHSRTRIDATFEHHANVPGKLPGAMRKNAAEVGLDEQAGHQFGIMPGGAGFFKQRHYELAQILGRDAEAAFRHGVWAWVATVGACCAKLGCSLSLAHCR